MGPGTYGSKRGRPPKKDKKPIKGMGHGGKVKKPIKGMKYGGKVKKPIKSMEAGGLTSAQKKLPKALQQKIMGAKKKT